MACDSSIMTFIMMDNHSLDWCWSLNKVWSSISGHCTVQEDTGLLVIVHANSPVHGRERLPRLVVWFVLSLVGDVLCCNSAIYFT